MEACCMSPVTLSPLSQRWLLGVSPVKGRPKGGRSVLGPSSSESHARLTKDSPSFLPWDAFSSPLFAFSLAAQKKASLL